MNPSLQRAWEKFAQSAPHNPELLNFDKYGEIVQCLLTKKPVHVARYNDGEWVFMLETEPYYSRYIARSKYPIHEVKDISSKLLGIIHRKPPYYIGIDSTTLAGIGSISNDYKVFQEKIAGLNIVYGEIFNAAVVMHGIDAIRKPLASRWILSVGPEYMGRLQLGKRHITVPLRSCWTVAPAIQDQVEAVIKSNISQQPVIVYSCSLLAKLLVDVMYHKFGESISQLDIGSCIDPWCGVNSRPWHPALARHYNLDIPIAPSPAETPTVILPVSISTGLPAPKGLGYGHQNFKATFGTGYGDAKDYGRHTSKVPSSPPLTAPPIANPEIKMSYSFARGDRSGSVINEAIFAMAHSERLGLHYMGTCGYNPSIPNHFEQQSYLCGLLGLPLPVKAMPLGYLNYIEIKEEAYSKTVYPNINSLLDKSFIEMLRTRSNVSQVHNRVPKAALHIRRGDVNARNEMRYTPNSYYVSLIKRLRELVPAIEIAVFSESVSDESFDEFQQLGCKIHLDGSLSFAWTEMINADVLVMSKSSFSFVPAIYNPNIIIYQPAWYAKLDHWHHDNDALLWERIKKLG